MSVDLSNANTGGDHGPEWGTVSLVGAGPGAADLITVRGQRRLEAADVVVYDELAGREHLASCRPEAERIYVGKRAGAHHLTQPEIGRLLVALARAGRRVVRLKGGDPLIFGRGGEEADVLEAAGVPVEIVPGVTAASAAGAAAGLPLTHREYASSVVLVTGHECAGKVSPAVDWAALVASRATLCIYMGGRRAESLAAELMAAGARPDLPAAAVAGASRAACVVRHGPVADLGSLVTGLPEGEPVLLIVGEAARSRVERRVATGAEDVARGECGVARGVVRG